MKNDSFLKQFSLSVVWLWMFLFALLPFALIILSNFLSQSESELIDFPLTLTNYQQLYNATYLHIFEKSFLVAGTATLLCLIFGYPFAYIIACMKSRLKSLLLLLVII